MKTRILSLLLAAVLLVGVMTAPVSAATPKDVYNFLKETAMAGEHDTTQKCYHDGFTLDETNGIYYSVYYWESSKNVEVSIFTSSFEVTLVLTSAMKLPYTAYIQVYDQQNTKGTVKVYASYNGADFSGFSSFSGDTSLKSAMLSELNADLPILLEITRAVIYEGKGYTLKDLGLTGYKLCRIHCWDKGKVTKQPTCVESGFIVYTCVNCGETSTEYIDPTGEHKWNSGTVVTAPTCTQDGLKRYTCTVCGTATKDEAIPALGHAWVLTEIVAAPGEDDIHGGTGRYGCTRCGEYKEDRLCAGVIFTDMPAEGNWAHAPIDWAYFSGITDGMTETTFAPSAICTRAQVVTFLWRAAGEPEPSSAANPFTDVKETDWFYKPVLWALEKGVTDGMTATTFAPKQNCTRSQVVTFLWRANGQAEPSTTTNPFTDVKESDWFYKPVLWALENGVTDGMTNTTFGSKGNCTRAQVVTFLYRCKDLKAAPEIVDAE